MPHPLAATDDIQKWQRTWRNRVAPDPWPRDKSRKTVRNRICMLHAVFVAFICVESRRDHIAATCILHQTQILSAFGILLASSKSNLSGSTVLHQLNHCHQLRSFLHLVMHVFKESLGVTARCNQKVSHRRIQA